MRTIESIVRAINKELVPQFEARLREHLATAWSPTGTSARRCRTREATS
jgi:hypothetical protein